MNFRSTHPAQSIRRFGAGVLALLALAAFGLGMLPSCVGGLCCATSAETAIHAQMPCCDAPTPSMSRENVSLRAATAGFTSDTPQTWVPVALVARLRTANLPSRVQATLATASRAHLEPTSPIFLLNAQFLI